MLSHLICSYLPSLPDLGLSVDFSTLPTAGRRRTVESVEKIRRFFHPSHSIRRGTALRAIIIIIYDDADAVNMALDPDSSF